MTAGARRLAATLAGLLAGCAPALRPLPPSTSVAHGADPAALAAEVHALSRRIEHEPTAAGRAPLVAQAVSAGQRCEQAAPATAACDYALGLALGMQVREHPATAREGLKRMVELLRRAREADPALDRAGPDRVLSLLLLRAPGWPLGPGDAEEGLAAARRAVALAPDHAPNLLALAEALAANHDAAGAAEAARRALRLAEAAEAAGVPDAADWRREAARRARDR